MSTTDKTPGQQSGTKRPKQARQESGKPAKVNNKKSRRTDRTDKVETPTLGSKTITEYGEEELHIYICVCGVWGSGG